MGFLAALRQLLPSIDLTDLAPFITALANLVNQYGMASRHLGAQSYMAARHNAGVRSRFKVPSVPLPSEEEIAATVKWAVYAPAEGGERPGLGEVHRRIEGASVRHMRRPERQTVATAASADPRAVRWARVPEGEYTCSFCMMLAIRGPVYESEAEAGGRNTRSIRNRNSSADFVGEGRFKFHDHCDCEVVPVFVGQTYEPPESVKRAEKLYENSTAKETGEGKIRAFRNAYEAERGRSSHH